VIGFISKTGDRLLRALVPEVKAEAGCVTDPYNFWQSCGCKLGSAGYHWIYHRLCHVYSNCSIVCNQFCQETAGRC
jgi:hypothetical protein